MFPIIMILPLTWVMIVLYIKHQDKKRRRQLEMFRKDKRIRDEESEACRAELQQSGGYEPVHQNAGDEDLELGEGGCYDARTEW